jgi:hypothetical protein
MCGSDYNKKKKIRKPTCVMGNLPWFLIYPLRKKKGDHFQCNMVGRNMERLGELARKPCCT